jgi:signal transduction histidine kinase
LDEPFPTTGRAVTEVRLFKLGAEAFWEVLAAHPEILRGIVATSAERASLHESFVQQHARLVSLGTMAAGFAHEINNPAAAVGRSAEEALRALRSFSTEATRLGGLTMTDEERAWVAALPEEFALGRKGAPAPGSIERSEDEDEVALWMEGHGVEDAWELSPALVEAGLDVRRLRSLLSRLPEGAAGTVLSWLGRRAILEELLREIRQGSSRISGLVEEIKSYAHLDRAPVEEVDLREGVEGALSLLGSRLRANRVGVTRDYAERLPRVTARVAELNQVWRNLLENALDAIGGEGEIRIRISQAGGAVEVEVADDGPGIPPEVRGRVFEPFFTTKGVGEGAGVGLFVARRIVEGHGGDIRLYSRPGETRFAVRLPVGLETGGKG